MKSALHVVGAGFLGSLFLEEWYKRQFALEVEVPTQVIDFDIFEERNSANQNVTSDAGRKEVLKADYMAELAQRYFLSQTVPCTYMIAPDNIAAILDGAEIVVDAVDNYETRRLLWEYCMGKSLPLMHLGVSQQGTGGVEWSWGTYYDSWPLSPVALGTKEYKAPPPAKLPPCDLVGLRGLGLNCGLAGAKALGLMLGHDPEGYFGDQVPSDLFTVWSCTNQGHRMVEAISFDEERNGQPKEVPISAKV